MTDLSITNTFAPHAKAKSSEVNENFDDVSTFVNSTGVPKVQNGALTAAAFNAANIDGLVAVPSLRTLGTGPQQAAAGDDPRFGGGVISDVHSAIPDPTTVPGQFFFATDLIALYVSDGVSWYRTSSPAGTISDTGAGSAPSGFMLCDGSAISRTGYTELFAAIGTLYGAGNGTTTFNLPDARQRVRVSKGASPLDTLAATGGERTHALIAAELAAHTHDVAHTHTTPNHTHTDNFTVTVHGDGAASIATDNSGSSLRNPSNHTHTAAVNGGVTSSGASTTGSAGAMSAGRSSGSAGSGTAHNNMQPYIIVNAIIKL